MEFRIHEIPDSAQKGPTLELQARQKSQLFESVTPRF